jgi:protein TonB
VGPRAVALSTLLHLAVAGFLLLAARPHPKRRATVVSVVAKADKPKPPPPKPPAPPPIVAPKPAAVSHAAAPVATAPKSTSPAPFVMDSLEMSNDDSPGGIAIPVAPSLARAATPAKAAAPGAGSHKKVRDPSESEEESACDQPPTKPDPIYKAEIEYTASARSEGIEGKLVLRIFVGADGTVTRVEIVKGVEPALDAAAVAAARTWRFKPSTRCGRPVDQGVYLLARVFELAD